MGREELIPHRPSAKIHGRASKCAADLLPVRALRLNGGTRGSRHGVAAEPDGQRGSRWQLGFPRTNSTNAIGPGELADDPFEKRLPSEHFVQPIERSDCVVALGIDLKGSLLHGLPQRP